MSKTLNKYQEIYDKMRPDVFYTAKELEVAPASMTAMVKRNMVEATNTTPKRYRKIVGNKIEKLLTVLNNSGDYPRIQYFSLYKEGRRCGMMCSYDSKNHRVLDCWGNPYNISEIALVQLGTRWFRI